MEWATRGNAKRRARISSGAKRCLHLRRWHLSRGPAPPQPTPRCPILPHPAPSQPTPCLRRACAYLRQKRSGADALWKLYAQITGFGLRCPVSHLFLVRKF